MQVNIKQNNNNAHDLFNNVRQWGLEKGIIGPKGRGTIAAQWNKVLEEIKETEDAISDYQAGSGTMEAIEDGIGDSFVTLILLADLLGLTGEDCLASAYNVISKRTGKMVDGQFKKDA